MLEPNYKEYLEEILALIEYHRENIYRLFIPDDYMYDLSIHHYLAKLPLDTKVLRVISNDTKLGLTIFLQSKQFSLKTCLGSECPELSVSYLHNNGKTEIDKIYFGYKNNEFYL